MIVDFCGPSIKARRRTYIVFPAPVDMMTTRLSEFDKTEAVRLSCM